MLCASEPGLADGVGDAGGAAVAGAARQEPRAAGARPRSGAHAAAHPATLACNFCYFIL